MRRTLTTVGFVCLGVTCAVLAAASSRPQPARAAAIADWSQDDSSASRGGALFALYCASCHGKSGLGDGPLAESLKTRTPDLTLVAKRNKGRFPAEELVRVIDGRTEVAAHGSREMPVWGLSFRQEGRLEDQEEEIWLQIRDLVFFLESIQRPGAKPPGRRD